MEQPEEPNDILLRAMDKQKIPVDRKKPGPKPGKFKPTNGFQKGRSGNPLGRKKRTPEEFELIQACRTRTPAALVVIEGIMTGGSNERNRLAAAQAIIERAYGKPEQPVTGAGGGPLQVVGQITFVRAG